MNVLLVTNPCFFPSRSCSGLTYDERLALWTVRHLFGPSGKTGRCMRSVKDFFGQDIEPVLALAKTIYIAGINAISATICNREEIALLARLEKEQNAQMPFYPHTKKDRVLREVGAVLAGHGCWLPHYEQDSQEKGRIPLLLAAE